MKQGYNKHTGSRVIGTLELTPGRADIEGFDEDGTHCYSGYTDMFWDGQTTQQLDGKDIYLDEDGEELTMDGITFDAPVEEGDDE